MVEVAGVEVAAVVLGGGSPPARRWLTFRRRAQREHGSWRCGSRAKHEPQMGPAGTIVAVTAMLPQRMQGRARRREAQPWQIRPPST
ncbi:hypothetical protein [Micromonospora inositola]|uniref:hypothetical protein n=1 Tax=Micromonospora inositola TaxID=47865 RepID=UPI000B5B0512|nr:hypothetical protein [Micromonospora inositola]